MFLSRWLSSHTSSTRGIEVHVSGSGREEREILVRLCSRSDFIPIFLINYATMTTTTSYSSHALVAS